MNNFIIIGYYTNGTPYEKEIEGLVKSCANFDLQCEIKGYDTRGTWHENTCIKPEFILDTMDAFPDKDLVYIDADGIVQQYPKLFDNINADLGVHYRDGRELLSGTVYVKNNNKMRLFIKCWINILSNYPTVIEQQGLDMTVKKYAKNQKVRVERLPATYTQIFDLMKNAGKPVIEHFQASRRFKRSVTDCSYIPKTVMGMKVREAGDGSFYLPRASRKVIDFLSKDFDRFPNEYRWYPKSVGVKDLNEMRRYFEGKECYLVGKGPSLDKLSKADFDNPRLPVICINESIHKVETLDLPNKVFAIQQDAWLKDTCRPEFAGLILSYSCRYWYPDVAEKYIFHYSQLGLKTNNITVVYALSLAKTFDSTGFRMLCFDACMNKDTGYGKCVGYTPDRGGSPDRFLSHKRTILKAAEPLPIEFISLKRPSCKAVDRQLQSHNNQKEHHVLFPFLR